MEIVTSPSEKEVIAKAQVLLEALPYMVRDQVTNNIHHP